MFFSTAAKTTGKAFRYTGQTLNAIQDFNFEESPFELWSTEYTVKRLTANLISTAIATVVCIAFGFEIGVILPVLLISPLCLSLGLALSSLGDYLEQPSDNVPDFA